MDRKRLLKNAQCFTLLIAKSSVLHYTKPIPPFYRRRRRRHHHHHHHEHHYNLLFRILFYSYSPTSCAAFIHYTSVRVSSTLNPSSYTLEKSTAKGLSWCFLKQLFKLSLHSLFHRSHTFIAVLTFLPLGPNAVILQCLNVIHISVSSFEA